MFVTFYAARLGSRLKHKVIVQTEALFLCIWLPSYLHSFVWIHLCWKLFSCSYIIVYFLLVYYHFHKHGAVAAAIKQFSCSILAKCLSGTVAHLLFISFSLLQTNICLFFCFFESHWHRVSVQKMWGSISNMWLMGRIITVSCLLLKGLLPLCGSLQNVNLTLLEQDEVIQGFWPMLTFACFCEH